MSMKFSAKMCLMITLKVTKNQGFTLSLEDTVFKTPQAGEEGGQIDHPIPLPSCFMVQVTFLLIAFSFSSKYTSFTKSAMPILLAKFACFNLVLIILITNNISWRKRIFNFFSQKNFF